jgi:GT2 family glycosyltransferase
VRAVSIVVPALGDEALLERALRSVRAELDHRAAGARNGGAAADEVLVVDDTGRGQLAPFLRARFPEVRHLGAPRNLGFARALTAGLEAARCELVFAMNSDLELEPGCLAPLVDALEGPEVFAAVPRVARADRRGVAGPERVESLVRIRLVGELLRLEQPCLEDPPRHAPDPALGPHPVPFALGGAMLLRRFDFEALGGFDPVFEPFYMEDVDLCWRAWRAGRRVLHVPTARARHAGRGTIGARVDPELREAVIGRNLLLLLWKHLDDERALRGHLDRLERGLRAAWVHEQRRELEVLPLALERLDQALASRSLLPAPRRSFARIVEESDHFAAAARLAN